MLPRRTPWGRHKRGLVATSMSEAVRLCIEAATGQSIRQQAPISNAQAMHEYSRKTIAVPVSTISAHTGGGIHDDGFT
jgi:hypothetical protein